MALDYSYECSCGECIFLSYPEIEIWLTQAKKAQHGGMDKFKKYHIYSPLKTWDVIGLERVLDSLIIQLT